MADILEQIHIHAAHIMRLCEETGAASIKLVISSDNRGPIAAVIVTTDAEITRSVMEAAEIIENAYYEKGLKDVEWVRHDDVTVSLLSLACIAVDEAVVSTWTDEQCQQAEKWAAAVHLEASDNDVDVPSMPAFLEQYNPRGLGP